MFCCQYKICQHFRNMPKAPPHVNHLETHTKNLQNMEITTKILKERFIEYNKRYFDDKLPMVDFRRHRTGNPFARLNTPNNGNLSISFCTVYNWNDKLIRDTLIHEMIHLHLVVNKKEWIFDHGIPFHLCCLKFLLKYRIDALGWFTKYPLF